MKKDREPRRQQDASASKEPHAPAVTVPEFLDPERSFIDQPPFNWIELDERLFPDDFFTNDHGFIYFLAIVVRYFPWTRDAFSVKKFPKDLARCLESIHPQYRDTETLTYTATKLHRILLEYPFCINYIVEKLNRSDGYSPEGVSRTAERHTSYAAYAASMVELHNLGRWVGLSEIAPDSSADPVESVQDAVQSTKRRSRFFRLLRSEALK